MDQTKDFDQRILQTDSNEYCDEWRVDYVINQIVIYVSGAIIVVINLIVVKLFEKCSKFEKRETLNEEKETQFIKMTAV